MRKLVFLFGVLSVFLVSGIAYSATSWYLPEGSTQGTFDLWILVNNPNSTTADIKYTFYTLDNGAITYSTSDEINSYTRVPANGRVSLSVKWLISKGGTFANLDNQPVSTKVECTSGLNIYAERAMYWDAGGVTWAGGHTARGVSGVEGCYTEISDPGASGTWPISINQSGSYKLTGNITNCPQDTNAIEITATDVTLDLNGFEIVGPGYNAGSSGVGILINSPGGGTEYNRVKITNGTIRLFRKRGISITSSFYYVLKDLRIHYNGEWGAYLFDSNAGDIEDCIFSYNGQGETNTAAGGLRVFNGNIIRNNNFYYNKGFGIYVAGPYNVVEGNRISATQAQGVDVNEAGICIAGDYNRIYGNHSVYNNTEDVHLIAGGDHNGCIFNSTLTAVQNDGALNTVTIADSGNIDL